ncbi:hypothetical protein DFQ30_010725 [Apophysomyces sp. BC1015]|nr:hypothetical protein DFQ30_010725 [Apophysomyces sp. BC1015]
MALGSGVLVFSSLFSLLPASQKHLNSDRLMYACFFAGACLTLLITYIIQWCAPNAIHACGHSRHHKNLEQGQLVKADSSETEEHDQPLLRQDRLRSDIEYGSTDYHEETDGTEELTAEEHGQYFTIGVQTAIAICIHKFPEGLIMFVSSQASTQLGLTVCAAMSIHNFIEGFMIALPLYLATGSRMAAFSYAALLGGLSQPLGAVLGVLALSNVDRGEENVMFGVIFGVVSGMMSLIAVQSMLPQAIRADARYVPPFFFIGIFTVGLASLLKSV